jgi:hypothetical protein
MPIAPPQSWPPRGRCTRPAPIRIEAATPLPLRHSVGIADAADDRAGVDVAAIDQPPLLMGLRIAAAG